LSASKIGKSTIVILTVRAEPGATPAKGSGSGYRRTHHFTNCILDTTGGLRDPVGRQLPVRTEHAVAIALDEDQLALAEACRGFVARHAPTADTRERFEPLAAGEAPESWDAVVAQGLTSIHLPEPHGGGGSLVDLAVVVEESARGLLPGPLLPTVLTSALLADARPDAQSEVVAGLIGRLAEGARGATATVTAPLVATRTAGGWSVSGTSAPVLGAPGADVLLLGAESADGDVWFVVDAHARPTGLTVTPSAPVDLTRGIGQIVLDGLVVPESDVLVLTTGRVRAVAAALFSAEAVGLAGWCVNAATEYAKIREQFGRTIGSFQAIKHKLARMFIQVQLMSAAAWDAARALSEDDEQARLATAAAAIICLPAAAELGLDTITLFGGIGYTWEHDAHLYWRRAMVLNSLAGPVEQWKRELGRGSRNASRRLDIDLVGEDPAFRAQIAATLGAAARLDGQDRRDHLAAAGLVLPHYPAPYGIAATPIQQIVIAQEYERSEVEQPKTIIGEWAMPTILSYGTEEQKDFFVPATLRGEISWCQLFSEPGAGSDLAALATKAERVEGGWKLTGQKIWTSNAHTADWAICLARTNTEVPKHKGITYFLVDMRSPGLEVRPLREANGNYLFNEVFLDEVFVPDARVVGEVDNGWRLARTTLSNERVSIGGMLAIRLPVHELAERKDLVASDADVDAGLGTVIAQAQVIGAMQLRDVIRRISGLEPGVEGSALKVAAGALHVTVTGEAMKWLGPASAVAEGPGAQSTQQYLSSPPMLIGGGTPEIQLNVIAERILGLPRD
jgi:3-oxochol-4-en-24-oyl-CoA dehydrogenase